MRDNWDCHVDLSFFLLVKRAINCNKSYNQETDFFFTNTIRDMLAEVFSLCSAQTSVKIFDLTLWVQMLDK